MHASESDGGLAADDVAASESLETDEAAEGAEGATAQISSKSGLYSYCRPMVHRHSWLVAFQVDHFYSEGGRAREK